METMSGMHEAVRKIEEGRRSGPSSTKAEPPPADTPPKGSNIKELRSIVDRIVRLEEEKHGIQTDIKTIYSSAKESGFNVKAVRIIVKREMEDSDQRAAREAVESEVDNLTVALGDFVSSPLGESAISRAARR